MPQRTILFVIDDLDVGGAQELLVLLTRSAAPRFRVVVCSLQQGRGVVTRLEAAGAEVHVLGRARPSIARPSRFLAYALGGLADIVRLCRRVRPDVIHCHLADATLLGTLASLGFWRTRVIITKHSPVLVPERSRLDWRNAVRRAALWLLYRRARTIAAVSAQTRQALLSSFGLSPARVVAIANGVPIPPPRSTRPEGLRAGLGLAPDALAVLNVGRLVPVKGQIHLVAAMAELVGIQPRLMLMIAGEGPCRQELVSRIAALGLADRVRLLGDRDDVAELLAATDLAVVSSLSEGTSLAVIEAMAAGKPIVATAVGGNLDLLADGQSALLVPAGDASALARALARLAEDPALAARLGATARDKARAEYSIDRVAAAYAALWEG
jgi:L-malate glycosyltransferase